MTPQTVNYTDNLKILVRELNNKLAILTEEINRINLILEVDQLETTVEEVENTVSTQQSEITTLSTTVDNVSDTADANATAIDSLEVSVTTIDGEVTALSSSVTSLSATVGSNTAAISSETSARATADGYLEGKYTLTATAGNVVTGMNITSASGGGTNISEIAFQADRFKVYNGSSKEIPFEISGGVVYIKKAKIRELDYTNIATGGVATTSVATNAITKQYYDTLGTAGIAMGAGSYGIMSCSGSNLGSGVVTTVSASFIIDDTANSVATPTIYAYIQTPSGFFGNGQIFHVQQGKRTNVSFQEIGAYSYGQYTLVLATSFSNTVRVKDGVLTVHEYKR